MRQDELIRQRVQRIEPVAPYLETPPARLIVCGIHGGDDFATGLRVGETVFPREGESTDALRFRAMRAVPADALRDVKGDAIGYFVYSGLPPDHCAPTARHLAGYFV